MQMPNSKNGRDQIWSFIALVLISLLFYSNTADPATPRTLVATVERVSDGDTLVALRKEE